MTLFKLHEEVGDSRKQIAAYPKLGSCINKIKKEDDGQKKFFIEYPTGRIEQYIMR